MAKTFYQEQRAARQYIKNTIENARDRRQPVRIDLLVFDMGFRFACSEKFMRQTIEEYPDVFEYMNIKDGILRFDLDDLPDDLPEGIEEIKPLDSIEVQKDADDILQAEPEGVEDLGDPRD